eukprot:TRINITY_DN74371_c0_g1_i1.p1 TRINITY_DN74371_c0_g1~~TRINITY_DN74371_c0_g1_i1.p1  ORF type:complete len:482 (+),score=114.00 TRINITY_DN74371_c0_g1_i1:62-1447(+)
MAITLVRTHPLIQRLLGSREDLLKCMSREHALLRVVQDRSGLLVENVSSANDLLVSGRPLRAGASTVLRRGDTLSFLAPAALSPRNVAIQGATTSSSLAASPLRGKALFLDAAVPQEAPPEEAEGDVPLVPCLTLSLETAASAGLLRCAQNEKCKGGGGDPLYEVKQVGAESDLCKVMCASCCSEACWEDSSLRAVLLPREILPVSWQCLFDSGPRPVRTTPIPVSKGVALMSWFAAFPQATSMELPVVCQRASEHEKIKHRQAAADAASRLLEAEERRAELLAEIELEEAEAHRSLLEVVDLAWQAGVNPGLHADSCTPGLQLQNKVEALREKKACLEEEIACFFKGQQRSEDCGSSREVASTRADIEESKDLKAEYTVTLHKICGDKMGIVVDHTDGLTFLIEEINDGLVKQWNDDPGNQEKINVGDRIVEVNNIRGDGLQLADECKKNQILNLRIRRP